MKLKKNLNNELDIWNCFQQNLELKVIFFYMYKENCETAKKYYKRSKHIFIL